MASLKYNHFRVFTNDVSVFGGKCPLCGTVLADNVTHECSNGLAIEPPPTTPVLDATSDQPAVFRKGRKLVAAKPKSRGTSQK